MKESFLTIKNSSEGAYKEKGSKFLAFAYPVGSESVVYEHLAVLRKKYHDARHHCYAFVLGSEGQAFKVNDDGEPSHSAGDPILGAIRSKNLTNILIVVVRYFGGIKLGVGGLVQAYKTSASQSLDEAKIIKKDIYQDFKIKFPYSTTGEVMHLLNKNEAKILDQDFKQDCEISFEIKIGAKQNLISKLEEYRSQKIIDSFEVSLT